MTFPAVTICNSNRISCDRFKTVFDQWTAEADTDTYDTLKQIACLNICPISIDVKLLSCNTTTSTPDTDATTTTTIARKKRSPLDPPPLGDMPTNLRAQYQFLALYMSLNEKVRLLIGHQFEDFIKECTFLGSDCLDIRYFSSYMHTCYNKPLLS